MSNVRPDSMTRIQTLAQAEQFIEEQIAAVRAQVGDKKVLLALSGGVDSSVAAYLTQQAGYQCIGATMRLYEAEGTGCSASLTFCDAVTHLEETNMLEETLTAVGEGATWKTKFRPFEIKTIKAYY